MVIRRKKPCLPAKTEIYQTAQVLAHGILTVQGAETVKRQ